LAEPRGLKNIYLNTSGKRRGSAFHGDRSAGQHYAAGHQSHQFFPIRHCVVQSCHRHVHERCCARGRPDAAAAEYAGNCPRLLCRNGRGLSDFAGQRTPLVATALLAVYIVLGILYESLVHPLTIISTLPSASVGAMLALMLFKIDLNVISIIGIILLIGIVKKNAIMMIDFALVAEREHGKTTPSHL
jgi:hypothetical protein